MPTYRWGPGMLLTPHGEREPCNGGLLPCLGRAPNPSWGTGTNDLALTAQQFSVS